MMNKKLTGVLSILVILAFIVYMILDSVRSGEPAEVDKVSDIGSAPENWEIVKEIKIREGKLKAVTVTETGTIIAGGESFLSCYDRDFTRIWSIQTPQAVTALSYSADTLFAATDELILVVTSDGRIIGEWGPYESNSILTSVTASISRVAFADAGNRRVFILDKSGEVISQIGQDGSEFVLPSPYFDIALDSGNIIYIANPGHRRIEKRETGGRLISMFGEPGTAPGAFCGCCNPVHIALLNDGFVTAEKGINRIKILDRDGAFIEYVSFHNKFVPSVPLDIAVFEGRTIYGANPYDSKLYVFERKK